MQTQIFNNNSSQCLFIGQRDLEEVIAQDSQELQELGGSFKAIADRMKQCIDFAEEQVKNRIFIPEEEWERVIKPILEKYKKKYGTASGDYLDWSKNPKAWREYSQEWARERAKFPLTWLDDKVAVLMYVTSRGQLCPFDDCRKPWNDDCDIYSRKTGRLLRINRGTIHLARQHHLLEKDNEYGITAKEFYEAFM